MAVKRKEVAGLSYEHIKSSIVIKTAKLCDVCPYKIYATNDEVVTLGTGNIHSNFIFILPTYDIGSKLGTKTSLTLLAEAYHTVTGRNMFEEVYVTRLVKCNKKTDHNLYNTAVSHCGSYLTYEIGRLVAKYVVFFGNAYTDYIENPNIANKNFGYKVVFKSYSPDVLFYNNVKVKDDFINNLMVILSNY